MSAPLSRIVLEIKPGTRAPHSHRSTHGSRDEALAALDELGYPDKRRILTAIDPLGVIFYTSSDSDVIISLSMV